MKDQKQTGIQLHERGSAWNLILSLPRAQGWACGTHAEFSKSFWEQCSQEQFHGSKRSSINFQKNLFTWCNLGANMYKLRLADR